MVGFAIVVWITFKVVDFNNLSGNDSVISDLLFLPDHGIGGRPHPILHYKGHLAKTL